MYSVGSGAGYIGLYVFIYSLLTNVIFMYSLLTNVIRQWYWEVEKDGGNCAMYN